jgi:hypothetical protein
MTAALMLVLVPMLMTALPAGANTRKSYVVYSLTDTSIAKLLTAVYSQDAILELTIAEAVGAAARCWTPS